MTNQGNNEQWDVIIVGGGISGCTTGALLADAGKKVLILEKGDKIGGRARTFTHDGYTMELGGHLLEDDTLNHIFRKFGKDYEMLKTTDVKLLWGDKWLNPKELYKQNRDDLRKISQEILEMSWDDVEKLSDIGLEDWLRQRTDSQGIIELFGVIGVLDYNMFSYNDIAASEALAMRKLHLENHGVIAWSQYPPGGTMALVRTLSEIFQEKGGMIRTQSQVLEVLIEEGKVTGVEVAEPKVLPNEYPVGVAIKAPVVILTLPLWQLPSVLPKDKIPEWYIEKAEWLGKHRDGWFSFYAGTDKSIMGLTLYGYSKLPRSGHPGGSMEPSAYDSSLAPPGKHLILCAASCAGHYEWFSDRVLMKEKMKAFEADMQEVFPDLKKHCLWKRWHVVDNFAQLQHPGLVGPVRPGFEIPGAKDLYLASETARVFGMGMDAAARVGIHVAERVLGRAIPEFEKVYHY